MKKNKRIKRYSFILENLIPTNTIQSTYFRTKNNKDSMNVKISLFVIIAAINAVSVVLNYVSTNISPFVIP